MRKRGCCLFRTTKTLVWLIIIILAIVWFFFYGGKKTLLQYFYPKQYEEYVVKYAAEYDIDKYLVFAVIQTESKFDPEIVSDAGAVGLMQLMEETAAECNEKAQFGYDIPVDLTDPEANIRIGCYYLSCLLDIFGDEELALIAYNGGMGNVSKWLDDEKFANGSGGLDFTPYKETNDYVDKVMKSYKRYRAIY